MVFSSPVFLFIFLPCTLALYGAASLTRSIRVKNAVLLFCSVCFYGYGGLNYLGLLAVSVVVNWGAGLLMEREKEGDNRKKASARRRMIFWLGIVWNLGVLIIFKYLNLLGDTAAWLAGTLLGSNVESPIPNIVLPIGISFFTFQIMSYLIDVYQDKVEV